MKVTITLNKQTYHRDIPISWDQVTFGDFLKLDSCGQDVLKVIALLTRLDYEQLKKAHIKNMDQVVAALGFINKPHRLLHTNFKGMTPEQVNEHIAYIRDSVPKTIAGYPIPAGLEYEEAQMYLELQNELFLMEKQKKTDHEKLERYAYYCAIYTNKHKNAEWCEQLFRELNITNPDTKREIGPGHHDYRKAEKMKEEFLNAPCTEVMAVGNFTLLRLVGLNLNINLNSLKAGSRIKRFKLALKAWVIRMGSAYHWTILLKKLGLKKMNY